MRSGAHCAAKLRAAQGASLIAPYGLQMSAEVHFTWQDNPKVAHPNESGKFVIDPFRRLGRSKGTSQSNLAKYFGVISQTDHYPGMTRQSIFFERHLQKVMDTRPLASLKRLRPRRRFEPAHDERVALFTAPALQRTA